MNTIDFRKTIRVVLDRRKMSVPSLAGQVSCNPMAIYNFLAGRTEMKADLLGKVLSVLKIKLDTDFTDCTVS
jgi:ribosome-binding protein aMBF1 (putative translation factor)